VVEEVGGRRSGRGKKWEGHGGGGRGRRWEEKRSPCMTSCTQSWERAILPDLCLLAPGGPSLFQSIIVSLRVTIATFVHALVDSPCFHLPYCILFGYLYSAERAVHGDSPANSLPVSQRLWTIRKQSCHPFRQLLCVRTQCSLKKPSAS